ncbi:MAG: hypothetical protein FWC16_00810 [Defluviitaleaceae bacterium]|nr:hypothetical protein [Defluviitaleaceae bacterium]MCL2273445.1 hypothetical protein [Defluviitaleaceae bacterium]
MSNFWIRQANIIAGGLRFNSDDLDISFDVTFDNDEEPDIASASIYNLSDNSINAIKKSKHVIINAGYRGDIGTIFAGSLQNVNTRWHGVDKVTSFTVGDGANEWLTTHVSETYAEGIRASAILEDLTDKFGLELGKLELVNDLTYPKGRCIDAMLKDAIIQIVRECNTTFKISKGRIFIMPEEEGYQTGFVLNDRTGLIGSPEVFEREDNGETKEGYKVKMLLNHRITVDSILSIESRTANGMFKVLTGRHRSGGEFVTEVERSKKRKTKHVRCKAQCKNLINTAQRNKCSKINKYKTAVVNFSHLVKFSLIKKSSIYLQQPTYFYCQGAYKYPWSC